jgi:hypothetical protein
LSVISIGCPEALGQANETAIRLNVHPAPAPRPVLRYQLLPELAEMKPGNPILGYLKCFPEQRNFFYSKEAEEQREKWDAMPLKELPVKELRGYGGNALRRADDAARLDRPDWQALAEIKRDGIAALIPEVQSMRELTAALKVRFRGEVADGRFDDALVTAKTMFALARHLGEHPSLIGDLVGIAIAFIAIGPLEEMIQEPGCPNLFWALANLPSPLVDLRNGLQGERTFLVGMFGLLDVKAPMSEIQLDDAVMKIHESLAAGRLINDPPVALQDVWSWLARRTRDKAQVAAARSRLVTYGLTADRVKVFPARQVILLDEKLKYEVRRDEHTKAMLLPYWQAKDWLPRIVAGKNVKGRKDDSEDDSLFEWLVPSVTKVTRAKARLEQRLGVLRCVEALRLHAATHHGRLPAKLDDIKLPLAIDPITGRPFLYQLKDGTAIIRGTAPAGEENNPAWLVRYEVMMRMLQ